MDLTSILYPPVHGGKLASVFGSYGWSGEGVPNLVARLGMLRMDVLDGLSIRFNPDDKKLAQAKAFGLNFGKKLLARDQVSGRLRAWKCILCGEIIISENRPNICPVCGAPADQFIEIPYNDVTFKQDTDETFVLVGAEPPPSMPQKPSVSETTPLKSSLSLKNKNSSITVLS